MAIAASLGWAGAAHADPGEVGAAQEPPMDFQLPFECGDVWQLDNYDSTHAPALDMVREPDQVGTEGAPLLAAADGTVNQAFFHDNGGNLVQIDHGENYFTTYIHMESIEVEVGDTVAQGDLIGAVGKTGAGSNDHPHLHYELAISEGDSADWGHEESDRVDPWFNGDKYAGDYGTTWNDVESRNCGGGDPGDPAEETSLAYTGPDALSNGAAAELTAELADSEDSGIEGKAVEFTLGAGDTAQTCEGTTGGDGEATCAIDPVDQPLTDGATVPLTVAFAGDDDYDAAEDTTEVTIKRPTELEFSGPESVANGEPAELAAVLTDTADAPVEGRTVELALGTGDTAQTCEGTTGGDGEATCATGPVEQPLNEDATVPVSAAFAGDDAYEPSETTSEVLLQYMTGRSYGLSADLPVLGIPITVDPTPDTGEVRTADAQTAAPECAQDISAVILSARTLCAEVATDVGPSSTASTASLEELSLGVPGLPVLGLSGVRSTSTSTCEAQNGSTDLELTVAGTPVEVGDVPNQEVDLGVAGTRLVVNEQVEEDDGSLTVNAARLTAPGGVEVVVASSTSAVQNCA